MRTAEVIRNTNETRIALTLNLDGSGAADIRTGVGFLDHMLTLFSHHGRFDLALSCDGDTWVDDHHTTEDIGIALGEAFAKALGEKRGIARYGSTILPMDEALILTALAGPFRPGPRELRPGDPHGEGGDLRHGAGGGILPGLCPQRGGDSACETAGRDQFSPYHRRGLQVLRQEPESGGSDRPDLAGEIPSTKGTL